MLTVVLIVVIVVQALLIATLALAHWRQKYDGLMVVTDTDEKKTFSLEINTDPEMLEQKRRIVLRVSSRSD